MRLFYRCMQITTSLIIISAYLVYPINTYLITSQSVFLLISHEGILSLFAAYKGPL